MLRLRCYQKPTLKQRIDRMEANLLAVKNIINEYSKTLKDAKTKEVSRVERPISPSKPKVSNGAVSYWRSFL
jgi:hypothetical protein